MKRKVKKADGSVVEVDDKYSLAEGESFVEQPTDITAALEQMALALKSVNDNVEAKVAGVHEVIAKLMKTPADKPKETAGQPPVVAAVGDEGWVRALHATRASQNKRKHTDEEVRFFRGVAASMNGGSWNPSIGLNSGDLKMSVLVEGSATLGGVLVPEEFDLEVIQETGKYDAILPFINFKQAQTDTINLAGLTSGPTAYVVGENAAVTASNPVYNAPSVSIKKIAAECTMSRELLQDALNIGTNLSSLLAEARAKLIGSELFSGSTLCTGLLSLSNPQVEPADYANLVYSDFNNLIGKIYPWARNRCVLAIHPDTMVFVRNIMGTDNHPIFKQENSPLGSIFGIPVVETYSMPAPSAIDAGENFALLLVPDRVIHAYQRMGMSFEVVTSGLDSASNNRDTNYLATVYLRERLGITNYAPLDIDGENHLLATLQQA